MWKVTSFLFQIIEIWKVSTSWDITWSKTLIKFSENLTTKHIYFIFNGKLHRFLPSYSKYREEKYEQTARIQTWYIFFMLCFFLVLLAHVSLSVISSQSFLIPLVAISNMLVIEKPDMQTLKHWLQTTQFYLKALISPE